MNLPIILKSGSELCNSAIEDDPLPEQLDELFVRCIESLDEDGVEIAETTVVGSPNDPGTARKTAKVLENIPDGKACIVKVEEPIPSEHSRGKLVLVSKKKDIAGRVFTHILLNRTGEVTTGALITQEIEGFDIHQEKSIKIDLSNGETDMTTSTREHDKISETTDSPTDCVEGVAEVVAHAAAPVLEVIRETTQEYDRLKNIDKDGRVRGRLAAAATAFVHPDKLAA